jgi:hypothetical protein
MRSFVADGELSDSFGSRAYDGDVTDHPEIAALYAITGGLMELVGPVFWAALIVLWVRAELITG